MSTLFECPHCKFALPEAELKEHVARVHQNTDKPKSEPEPQLDDFFRQSREALERVGLRP